MLIYVNDTIATLIKTFLRSQFYIKEWAPWNISLDIASSSEGPFLAQCKYPVENLQDMDVLGAKSDELRMEQNLKLTNTDGGLLGDAFP